MRKLIIVGFILLTSGCATWSTSNVQSSDNSKVVVSSSAAQNNPEMIFITEKDITDKKYRVLGDIEVTVNKTTIFHKDPTREMVNEELKKKAAELAADAVILVRYGTVGVSPMSWGALDGKGRAIVFLD